MLSPVFFSAIKLLMDLRGLQKFGNENICKSHVDVDGYYNGLTVKNEWIEQEYQNGIRITT
jgi:hypothetical protein